MILRDKTVLVTGGTGSFGTKFIEVLLERHDPKAIRVFSRDELKQSQLQRRFADDGRLRYLIGDVRDLPRLVRATQRRRRHRPRRRAEAGAGVRVQPLRGGADERPRRGERRQRRDRERRSADARAQSTDKAVNPVNLYGATKLCAEKLVTQGNAYAADSPARFANVRYGNVVGSRGSVIPLFKAQAEHGVLTITDERMTRFWITLEQAVDFVIYVLEQDGRRRGVRPQDPEHAGHRHRRGASHRTPSSKIIGIRPGEKLHEVLVTEDESRHALRARRQLRDHAGVRVVAAAAGRRRLARSRAASATRATRTTSGSTPTSCVTWRRTSRPCREHADVPPIRPPGHRRGGHRGGGRGAARRLITQGPTHRAVRGSGRRVHGRARTSSRSRTAPPRSTAPPSRRESAKATTP